MTKFLEKERELPVLYDGYDIAVVGGGIAGVSAALAAARAGKRVLLLERMFALGGLGTLGLVTIYLPLCDGMGHQVSYGITEELLRLSISHGWERDYPDTWLQPGKEHGAQRFQVRYNAQVFAVLLEQLLQKEGVDLLYGTAVCGTIRQGNKVTALIVENKDGRSAIPVQGVVDASGDADIFALSGVETALYKRGNKMAAWYYETLNGRNQLCMVGASDVLPEDGDSQEPEQIGTGRISGIDSRETTEWLLRSHSISLERFLVKGDVSETHSLSVLPTIPQLRMTRRMKGRYTLDEGEDHARFEDSVGMVGDWRKRGPVFEIPMGTLCSEELVNVTAAGRCISVTDAMWDITRVIPAAAVTGQAAGVMLAISSDTAKLSASAVQQELRRQGVRLHLDEIDN
ncbi:MAG TPA: FAD-dependent oxidoreductase [Candidatus Eisenbergiella merdipullorum]|uniref:FAD-dependent oxidoreductase n=1 Tax=Candidatus Eisenbergiella merdipullorum TaxID=2838553 RepID=A0A9D2I7C7_9FIRM|nr:FAD-dependent oxidoreductase [Candidatus Eisenbergiella merdipullorum]